MRGMYFEFARLAIRLLVAIYRNQVQLPPAIDPVLYRDSHAFLERHK